ncbi:adhesin, partial [Ectothiorhodospira haloalkaliphila]
MHTLRPFLALALLTSSPVLFSVATADIPSARDDCAGDLVETTPSAEFTPLEGGAVVRHERTGLEWRRCPEGMNWNGSGCDGNASWMNWQTALQHAHDLQGWRLPNINELRSIVEFCRRGPAVNQHVFPDTPSSIFWSASPVAGYSDRAWSVHFARGNDF